MRILFVGASGYGNVGDDAYVSVFAQELGAEHELLFESPAPDARAMEWAQLVVVGGGGLIYCNDTSLEFLLSISQHHEYMFEYLDHARERRKPVAFVSCGVQLNLDPDWAAAQAALRFGTALLGAWEPYLDYASLVTVRSRSCEAVVRAVAPRANVHFAPDLAYLMRPPSYASAAPGYLLVVPRDLDLKEVDPYVEPHLAEGGSPVYFAAFSRNDADVVDALGDRYFGGRSTTRQHLSPKGAMALLSGASKVVTWRYHGAIMARAAGVRDVVVPDQRYKSLVEEPPQDLGDARRHLELLRELIATESAKLDGARRCG